MTFVEYGNCECWTPDDRFCVLPLPECWVGIDYAPDDGSRIEYSPHCDTREEAMAWCEQRASQADPCIIVSGPQ